MQFGSVLRWKSRVFRLTRVRVHETPGWQFVIYSSNDNSCKRAVLVASGTELGLSLAIAKSLLGHLRKAKSIERGFSFAIPVFSLRFCRLGAVYIEIILFLNINLEVVSNS